MMHWGFGKHRPSERSLADILAEGREILAQRKAGGHGSTGGFARKVEDFRRRLEEEESAAAPILQKAKRIEARETARAARWAKFHDVSNGDRGYLEALATHEAGHAVVGILEGAGIDHVAVFTEAHPTGGRSHRRATGGRYRSLRASSARCALAGEIAADLAGLEHRLPAWTHWGDTRDALEASSNLPKDRAATREILERNWPAVRALAEELIEVGHVDGDDALEIVRRWATDPVP